VPGPAAVIGAQLRAVPIGDADHLDGFVEGDAAFEAVAKIALKELQLGRARLDRLALGAEALGLSLLNFEAIRARATGLAS
jgi:hypothetical protein